MKQFKSNKHMMKVVKTIPVSFLPSDARVIKHEDGGNCLYSPWWYDFKHIGGKWELIKSVNMVTGEVLIKP